MVGLSGNLYFLNCQRHMLLIPIDMPKKSKPIPWVQNSKTKKPKRRYDTRKYQNGTSNKWLDSSKQNKTELIWRGVRQRKKGIRRAVLTLLYTKHIKYKIIKNKSYSHPVCFQIKLSFPIIGQSEGSSSDFAFFKTYN